jgi:hypothetical protein
MFVAWPVSEAAEVFFTGEKPGRGVVVGDDEQQGGDGEPDERAEVDVGHRGAGGSAQVVHHPGGDRIEGERGQDARQDQALIERPLDVARGRLHREGPDDRGDDRDAAQHEREQHHGRALLRKVRIPAASRRPP